MAISIANIHYDLLTCLDLLLLLLLLLLFELDAIVVVATRARGERAQKSSCCSRAQEKRRQDI